MTENTGTTTATTTVDADDLFVAKLGELPYTIRWASDGLWEAPDRGGILRRLMAAMVSAQDRGIEDSEWDITPIGEPDGRENGAVWEYFQTAKFVVKSSGGSWSSRSWEIRADVEICIDECGVESIKAVDDAVGTATVSSRHNDDTTTFTGVSVARMAAGLVLRCAGNNWCRDMALLPTTPEPEWRQNALRGLAQILSAAADAGDPSGQAWLTTYLSDGWLTSPSEDITCEVLEDLVCRVYGAEEQWKSWTAAPDGDLGEALQGVKVSDLYVELHDALTLAGESAA
jgi:hypothetical protein